MRYIKCEGESQVRSRSGNQGGTFVDVDGERKESMRASGGQLEDGRSDALEGSP